MPWRALQSLELALYVLNSLRTECSVRTKLDFFGGVLEITVLIVIGIELLSLYWYSRFYHKINANIREAVQKHCDTSDALVKALKDHVDKVDEHVIKLDEHISLYTKYMETLNKHVLMLEDMMRNTKL